MALFTLDFGIASESDVVEPGDDTPIVSLFQMATRDKLMYVADSVVYLQVLGRQTRFIFSITEYKSSSRQISERFLTTFVKLKVVSPTAMAKLPIHSASLESLVINREIFIPNREIVIIISKIGRSPAKSGDLEALLKAPHEHDISQRLSFTKQYLPNDNDITEIMRVLMLL